MDQTDYLEAPAIDERDELIAALTQQLEYAAEQLDRYQRAGAPAASGGSSRASTASALTPELNEGLTRFLEQWEQMQAGFTLGRIEVQLEEIRELVSNARGNESRDVPAAPLSDLSSLLSSFANHQSNAPQPGRVVDEQNSWERIKSSFLDGDAAESHPQAFPDQTRGFVSENDPVISASAEPSFSDTELIDILGLELPPLVDFENAASEQLENAIQSRDEVIAVLLSKVAEIYQNSMINVDLGSLNGFEEEKAAINQLYDRLNEQLKVAELQNSLERARLSREQAKLSQKEMVIEKKLLQLGLISENSHEATKTPAKPEKRGGWLSR